MAAGVLRALPGASVTNDFHVLGNFIETLYAVLANVYFRLMCKYADVYVYELFHVKLSQQQRNGCLINQILKPCLISNCLI